MGCSTSRQVEEDEKRDDNCKLPCKKKVKRKSRTQSCNGSEHSSSRSPSSRQRFYARNCSIHSSSSVNGSLLTVNALLQHNLLLDSAENARRLQAAAAAVEHRLSSSVPTTSDETGDQSQIMVMLHGCSESSLDHMQLPAIVRGEPLPISDDPYEQIILGFDVTGPAVDEDELHLKSQQQQHLLMSCGRASKRIPVSPACASPSFHRSPQEALTSDAWSHTTKEDSHGKNTSSGDNDEEEEEETEDMEEREKEELFAHSFAAQSSLFVENSVDPYPSAAGSDKADSISASQLGQCAEETEEQLLAKIEEAHNKRGEAEGHIATEPSDEQRAIFLEEKRMELLVEERKSSLLMFSSSMVLKRANSFEAPPVSPKVIQRIVKWMQDVIPPRLPHQQRANDESTSIVFGVGGTPQCQCYHQDNNTGREQQCLPHYVPDD